MAIAAGCAITGIESGLGSERVGSAVGARKRACGCSSSAPVKSISTGPSAGFSFKARRLDACDPARNATFDPVRLSAVSGTSASTSSSSAPSIAAFSAAAEINSICGAGFAALQQFAYFLGQQRIAAHQRHAVHAVSSQPT